MTDKSDKADKTDKTDKDWLFDGCDDGFKESVQRMVGALIQGYILAKTPADKKKALQAFQDGLAIYKEAYKDAQQVIGTVFT